MSPFWGPVPAITHTHYHSSPLEEDERDGDLPEQEHEEVRLAYLGFSHVFKLAANFP